MHHMNFDHQMHIFDPRYARPVRIIGAGAVGSHVAPTLAKLGCTDITVMDADEVASHNIPPSAYWRSHLMQRKVVALSEIVMTESGIEITAIPRMYEGEVLKSTTVACVDNMETRLLIWERCKRNPLVGLMVDTRMAEQYIEVFAIRTCDPDDIEYYEHFLYPSKDALPQMCGRHGSKPAASTAANAACAALTQWWQSRTLNRHLTMLCGHFQEV